MRDRAADVAYRTRQAKKGLRQLSVWVPGEVQALLVELAAHARILSVAQSDAGGRSLKELVGELQRLVEIYRPRQSGTGAPD